MRRVAVFAALGLLVFGATIAVLFLLGPPESGMAARIGWAVAAGIGAVLVALAGPWCWRRLSQRARVPSLPRDVRRGLRARLAAIAREARGDRVWVLVIGERGAGKSSAMEQSRVFKRFGAAAGGADGLEAWISDGVCAIEVPSRFAKDGGIDRLEWLEVLGLLRRRRAELAVEVVVVTVDAAALSSREAAISTARMLGRQLQDVAHVLGVCPSVVLLLSRSDVIPGWVEAFGALPRSERAQPLGVRLSPGCEREAVEGAIHELARHLECWGSRRLSDFRALSLEPYETRRRGFELPAQVRGCAAAVGHLCEELRHSSGSALMLTGVYFASATQGAQVVDFELSNLRAGFGLRSERPLHVASNPNASMFLSDLFGRGLRELASWAVPTDMLRKRRLRVRALTFCASLGAAVAMLAAWSVSRRNNLDLIESSATAVAKVRNTRENLSAKGHNDHIDALASLGSVVETLEAHSSAGPPIEYGFGLHYSSKLRDRVRDEFEEAMKDAFTSKVRRTMDEILAHPTQWTDNSLAYATLGAYLMMADPERLDVGEAAGYLVERWHEALPPEARNESRNLKLVTTFASLRRQDKVSWGQANTNLVNMARRTLSKEDAEYDIFLARAEKVTGNRNLAIDDILPGTSGIFESDQEVQAAYTKKAWNGLREEGTPSLRGLHWWVLAASASDEALLGKLEKRYFESYSVHWIEFLARLRYVERSEVRDVIGLLEDLATDKLHEKLIRRVEEEMLLFDNSISENIYRGLDEAKQLEFVRRLKNPAWQELEPLLVFLGERKGDLDKYTEALAGLGKVLRDGGNADDVKGAVRSVRDAARKIARSLDERHPGSLDPLFLGPVQAVERVLRIQDDRQRRELYRQNICDPFRRSFVGRFPFADESQEVDLEQFAAFFAPEGSLWKFYKENLATLFSEDNCVFELVGSGEASPPKWVGPFLMNACHVREAFFRPDSKTAKLRVEFSKVRCPKKADTAAAIAIDIDGVLERFSCGHSPGEKGLDWTGKRSRSVVELEGGSHGGTKVAEGSGSWAVFRLFAKAEELRATEKGWYRVAWHQEGTDIEVRAEVRVKSGPSVIERQPFRDMACSGD